MNRTHKLHEQNQPSVHLRVKTMATSEIKRKSARHIWEWIWLGYTGFLFIDPLLEPSRNLWLGTLAAFAVFLYIFFTLVKGADRKAAAQFWMILATFALGLIVFPWNQGASTFFVYAAAFLPFTIDSTRRVLVLFAAECVAILGEGWLFNWKAHGTAFYISWPNTWIAIFLVVIIGGGNIFYAGQKRADCALRAAQEENLELAAVAERERIARDLHDVLGHTLSLIVLKAELAGRLIPIDPARAIQEIKDVERTSRTALAEVREAIVGYRTRGLAAEIESARTALDAAGVTLILESDPVQETPLNPQEETAIALVLREAVTNIVRHARATTCRLRFVTEGGQRRLVVEDDGQHIQTREGNGVRGMRQRIENIGGRFQLERGIQQDHGTRLTVDLPIREAAAL
jgi:two-component system sensor histidine kinase DesK